MFLNEKIRHYVSRWAVPCDLADKFPMASLTEADRKQLWSDDNIHPTVVGYDEIGKIIFNCIISENYVLSYIKSTTKRSHTFTVQNYFPVNRNFPVSRNF